MTAKAPSFAEMVAMANDLAAHYVSGGTPHLKIVSDRSERDARIEEAQRKIEAALLFIRQGKFNFARQRTEEATRLLRGAQMIGFDEGFGE